MEIPASEFARYDLRRQMLPSSIRTRTQGSLLELADTARERLPGAKTVTELVALPPGRGWGYKSAEDGADILIFGTFRSDYRMIVTMAELFEDFYAATTFLPRIVPIRTKVWRGALESDGRLLRAVQKLGIVGYTRLDK